MNLLSSKRKNHQSKQTSTGALAIAFANVSLYARHDVHHSILQRKKKNKNQEIEFSMHSLKQIELLTNQWIRYVDNVSCDQSNSLYRAMSEREEQAADGTHSRQITQ